MAKFLNRNLRIETGKKVIMGDSAESFLKYDGSDLLINVDAAQVLQLNSTTQILGLSGDTNIELNQTNNTVIIEAANATVGTFDADGLTLASGASVNEFSIDGSLVGDSDDAVPTEKAVKTYVDNAIGGSVDHNSTTGLQGGDSTASEFYHLTQDIHDGLYSGSPIIGMGAVAGTNMEVDYGAHVVTVDINGSEVLDLTASTQRLGAAASAGKVEVGSASVDLYYSGNKTMTTSPDGISVQDGSGTSPSIFFKNDGGTTLFRIVANDTETNFQHWIGSSPEDIMKATKNGAVELYYDNTKAFYTNSTGSVVRDGSGNNPALYLENSSDQTEARFRANTTSLFIEIGSSFENVFRANENGAVLLYYNDVSVFETTSDGIKLNLGAATINEFSIDGTLGDDSDTALPTEKAVKTYVDTEIANIATDQIIAGDSYVKVVDDGTAAGYIEVVADGVQVQYWDAQAATIRMGKSSAAGRVDVSDTEVTANIGAVEVLDLAATIQRLGVSGDSRIDVSQASGTINMYASSTQFASFGTSQQILGVTGDTVLILNQTNNTIDGVVANANVLHLDDDGDHRVGASGDNAKLILDETNHKAQLHANSAYYLEIEGSGGEGGTLRYYDNSTEIISASENEIYIGDNGFVASGTRYYASLDNNYLQLDAAGFRTRIDSTGLILDRSGTGTYTKPINQLLNTVDGDAIDAASTDTQIASAKLIYNTIGNITPNEITQGDSYVRVVDDGTAAGYVEVVADGVQVQYWDAQAATIRMGKESAAGRVVVNDTEVILSVGSLEYVKVDASSQVFGTLQGGGRFTTNSSNAFIHAGSLLDTELIFTATDTSQTLGVSGNTTFNLNQSTGTAIISTPGGTMLSVDGNVQRLGGSTDTFLSLTQNTNTVDLRAGNVSVLNATDTAQTFGVSGDASLVLNQTADTFVLAAGANTQISGGLTSLALGVAGDTTITLDQSADTVTITAGGESQVLVETSGTTITDDLTVSGDLFVDGTTWVVHNQEVTTSDNLIVINYGETGSGVTAGSAGFEIDRGQLTNYQFLFVEASDTFRIGEVGSLQAVATREDAPTDTRVPWWNDSAKRYDTAGSSSITINTSTDVIAFNAADGEVATLEADGLTLASGTNVNEFSIDGTLAGDSDNAVPTEQAVKTYVDTEIANISTDQITAGDSYVKVTDDGTDVGWIEIVADGVQVAYFDPSAATQRIGKASSAGKVEVTDTAVELYYAGAKAMYTHVDGITVRDTNSTGPKLIFEDQNDSTMGQIDCLANIIEMKVGSSLETVFKATINAAAELYYDNVKVFETTSDGIKLNLGAATINEFSTDGTLAGDSDTAVPTEKAVKLYVDTKVGTEVYSGIADIVNGDTTATVIFDTAQADADYTITTHIVNTTDLSPSLYVHMTTEYDENGFTEVFSGPMDSGNYKLHFVITRADQGV